MKLRHSIVAALAAMTVAGAAFAQGAEGFPSRPIRLIVASAPGGTQDTVGRIVAEGLSERLGQPVVADNRGGAAGVLGCEITAKSNPDGHTMVIVSASYAVHPSVRKTMPYDSLRDLVPVGIGGTGPYLLATHPSVPAKTLGEFITWAKSRPGQVNYASVGVGSPPHLAAELLNSMAGLKTVQIPYKGGGAVMPDLLAGRVSYFFGSVSTLVAHIRAGRLHGIGVTTLQRDPAMPELPTFDESGLKGYEVTGWYGILAPAKTPKAIVNRLNTELRHTAANPQIQKQLRARGIEPSQATAEEFAALLRREIPKWAKLMKAAGVEPE
jgi:tripartite-type tricarboxylate transporter receptor subunit TctC